MSGIVYANYRLTSNHVDVMDVLEPIRISNRAKQELVDEANLDYICIENEKNEIEIFIQLIQQYFDSTNTSRDEITYLMYACPDNIWIGNVQIPYFLLEYFGMKNATAILLDQMCATTLEAINMGSALIDSKRADKVMILSITHGDLLENRYIGKTVVGDGAAIMVLGQDNVIVDIKDVLSKSNGTYSLQAWKNNFEQTSPEQVVKAGAQLIKDILKKNNLTFDDVKMIIPQNINQHGFALYADILGISAKQFFTDNIPFGGHLSDVDTIRNFTDLLIKDGNYNQGDKFILYGLGTIGKDRVYCSVLLEKNE